MGNENQINVENNRIMKYLYLILLAIVPIWAFPQYNASCFRLDNSNRKVNTIAINSFFSNDTIITLEMRNDISEFYVSGVVNFDNENDSYVRVVLRDSYNYEHLVYDNYPLLAGTLSVSFSNIALETKCLDNITPSYLRIEMKNASLNLTSLSYVGVKASKDYSEASIVARMQNETIVDKLNASLKARHMTWRAGVTSLSEKSYEEKKALFGGKLPQLYGFDYYIGGVFVMPDVYENRQLQQESFSSRCIPQWDWRNHWGKNWMTPVRLQFCGSCWAHSAIGTLEAYINLYYNRMINYDLSEQELISCSDAGDCSGGNVVPALDYIITNGIVQKDCFRDTGINSSCDLKCSNPDEIVKMQSYNGILLANDSLVKNKLFHSPMALEMHSWSHDVVLVGYKTISYGDTIHIGLSPNDTIVIDSIANPELYGKTAWLIKNSHGPGWGEKGYGYVICGDLSEYGFISICGKITSMLYNDSDIVWEDVDGDGYYNWGVGPRPITLPSWVHWEEDGDDTDASMGPLNTYGYCKDLANIADTLLIEHDSYYYNDLNQSIKIIRGATLRLLGDITLLGYSTITIEANSTLIIDGAKLRYAKIIMEPQSHLIVRDGGEIYLKSNESLYVPLGATVDVSEGSIYNRPC